MRFNREKAVKTIIDFLIKEFRKRNKTKAVIGISGGLDSGLTAFLCQKAGLDLYAAILPYQKRGLRDSKRVCSFLNLGRNRAVVLDIGPWVDLQIKDLQGVVKLDKVDKGNLMARQRMVVQYAVARSLDALVVGTENLSEYHLGYFTLHGDSACDLNPLACLFKTQVIVLAKYLGLPKWLFSKVPSANFWPGQSDEKELGFSYKKADPIIHLYKVKGIAPSLIVKKYGFKESIVLEVAERIKLTNYKRQRVPRISL